MFSNLSAKTPSVNLSIPFRIGRDLLHKVWHMNYRRLDGRRHGPTNFLCRLRLVRELGNRNMPESIFLTDAEFLHAVWTDFPSSMHNASQTNRISTHSTRRTRWTPTRSATTFSIIGTHDSRTKSSWRTRTRGRTRSPRKARVVEESLVVTAAKVAGGKATEMTHD